MKYKQIYSFDRQLLTVSQIFKVVAKFYLKNHVNIFFRIGWILENMLWLEQLLNLVRCLYFTTGMQVY